MDLSYMLFLQGDSRDPQPSKKPDDDEPVTVRDPEPPPAPNPLKPLSPTPDANPIDPRVGQPW